MCVCGGGGVEAISKLKGAGAYLHMFCLPWPAPPPPPPPAPPMDLKSDFIKENACPISIFCK